MWRIAVLWCIKLWSLSHVYSFYGWWIVLIESTLNLEVKCTQIGYETIYHLPGMGHQCCGCVLQVEAYPVAVCVVGAYLIASRWGISLVLLILYYEIFSSCFYHNNDFIYLLFYRETSKNRGCYGRSLCMIWAICVSAAIMVCRSDRFQPPA